MSRIYIPMREDLIPENIKSEMHYEQGYYIENNPANRIKFQDYLPYGFKDNIKPLQIDLIPKTSWGASLAGSLTSECWSSIRKPFIHYHGNRCQICGQKGKDLSASIKDVDTHEIWEYSPLTAKNKVQTLKGFIALCSSCHLMFHLGFARIKNKGDVTIKRLQRLEKLSDTEIDLRIKNIDDIWAQRSQHEWMIDVSVLRTYGFSELKFKDKTDQSKFIF